MKKFAVFSILALVGVVYWSVFYEPGLLEIRREKFHWNQSPAKIAFFSDLHAGAPFINLAYIKKLVASINAENVDFVFIGGDLVINGVVGGHVIPFDDVAKELAAIKSKRGVFAVLGNHDWWNDANAIRHSLEKIANIRVLDNETRLLSFDGHSKFNLIALGDDMTDHVDLENAFNGADNHFPKIVLAHDPGALMDMEPRKMFDLVLAGHMHGGQINLPLIGPLVTPGRAPRTWAHGWSDLPQGKLFVTKGIGTSILPIRFNAPPELVILKLERLGI